VCGFKFLNNYMYVCMYVCMYYFVIFVLFTLDANLMTADE